MILIGQKVLQDAGKKHRPLRQWLENWAATVQVASWGNLADVRKTYPSADGVTLKSKIVITVFNVKGNTYRLLTLIDYPVQTVQALEVLTHAEYDKQQWKERY